MADITYSIWKAENPIFGYAECLWDWILIVMLFDCGFQSCCEWPLSFSFIVSPHSKRGNVHGVNHNDSSQFFGNYSDNPAKLNLSMTNFVKSILMNFFDMKLEIPQIQYFHFWDILHHCIEIKCKLFQVRFSFFSFKFLASFSRFFPDECRMKVLSIAIVKTRTEIELQFIGFWNERNCI